MSKIIEIIEENNELKLASEDVKIVCGNSNYKLKFLLSEDWRKVNHKAVVFCVCGKKITQTMVYDECEIPVMNGGGVLFVSLVAGDEDYQLATTDVKIELVETFSNNDFVEYEPLRNDLASLLGAVNDIERGNISVKKAEIADNVINPNLLINGDFKVNQRGATTYNEVGKYTVDRWKLLSGTLEVVSGGIMLNGSITQILEHSPNMPVVASSNAGEVTYENGAVTITTTERTLITFVKLEVGTYATTFCPRTYAEEISMCQRFYQVYYGYKKALSGYTYYEPNVAYNIPLRNSGTKRMYAVNGYGTISENENTVWDITGQNELVITASTFGYSTQFGFTLSNGHGTFVKDHEYRFMVCSDAEIY